jgi:hypothetical protein
MRKTIFLFVALLVLPGLAAFAAEGPAKVDVRLTEYAIEMPHTLPPGPASFVIRNDGQKTHSFQIQGPGIEDMTPVIVKPHKTDTVQVTLQPGDYTVFCPIGSHSAKGMTMTLSVQKKK